jgi:hypothetical protein
MPHALHDVFPALGWTHPLGQFAHVSSLFRTKIQACLRPSFPLFAELLTW